MQTHLVKYSIQIRLFNNAIQELATEIFKTEVLPLIEAAEFIKNVPGVHNNTRTSLPNQTMFYQCSNNEDAVRISL
jgi:hypothetical protein